MPKEIILSSMFLGKSSFAAMNMQSFLPVQIGMSQGLMDKGDSV